MDRGSLPEGKRGLWHRYWVRLPKLLILLIVGTLFLIPYAWTFLSSFKTTSDIFKYATPVSWRTFLPPRPTLENFEAVFFQHGFHRNMLNSLIAAGAQMVGTIIVCSLAAFVFSRLRFRGRDLLFGAVMLVAFVPFEVIMVPLYVVVRSVGLGNTYFALFLPWIASPFGVFLLRQSMLELPRDYDDAAEMDGASHLQLLWHIILPSVRPSLITLGLMSFLSGWNAFLWPLIVIQDSDKQLIQVALATFTLPTENPAWGEIFAGATIATVPILIAFIALQRYYIRGVTLAGKHG